jgi:hypothetical protein
VDSWTASVDEQMPDHDMSDENDRDAATTRGSPFHSLDSLLWPSSRGAPRLYVLVGMWIFSGMTAIAAAGIAGFVIFGILLWIGTSLGVVSRYESGYTPPIVLFLVCATAFGIIASILVLSPAMKATRLYLSPPPLGDEDEEDGSFQEHTEPDGA